MIFRRLPTSKGFTMIELLVAATILAVLAAIGLVSFTSANQRARDGKRKADMEQARSGLELFRSDKGTYPYGSSSPSATTWDTMITALNSSGYLNTALLTDPKNTGNYVYSYTPGVGGKSYTVCAYLETTQAAYCLSNP